MCVCLYNNVELKKKQEGLQRRLHNAPRAKRETRKLPTGGRCL